MYSERIQQAVARGRTEKAISLLQERATQLADTNYINETSQLAGRWAELQRQERMGILSFADAGVERQRIVDGILRLSREMDALAPTTDNDRNAPTTPVANGAPEPQPAEENKTPWPSIIIGAVLAMAIVLLVLFIPCPSSSQYEIIHVFLALAAAGLGAAIPGMIEFAPSKRLRAVGALALFLIVYIGRPEKSIAEQQCVSDAPFTYTVALEPQKPSPDYPDFDREAIEPQIWLGNEWRTGEIDQNLVTDFKNVPARLREKQVRFRLLPDASPWQTERDSILITPDGSPIRLVPSGVLATLNGVVKDATGEPLAGAVITLQALTDTTAANGRFTLNVPLELQREKYALEVRKSGFQTWRNEHYAHSEITVLLSPSD